MKNLCLLPLFLCHVLGQTPFIANYTQLISQSIDSYGFLTVKRSSIAFKLYTRDNYTNPIPLYAGQLQNITSIRKNNMFKIITHGYQNSASSTWMLNIKNAYLTKADYNVILLDWGTLATAFYPYAAGYTKGIGVFLGQLILDLNLSLGVPFSNIHMIGHSLGAHISGFAGNYIQYYTGRSVGRISGCDPAGPLFFLTSNTNRLDATDAVFVDVIHTDSLMYGYILPLGAVDFYPNGGVASQPGCVGPVNEIIFGCSHARSHDLFIESINSNGFVSSACPNSLLYIFGFCSGASTAIMGENVNQKVKGLYQLTTNAAPSYARNGAI